MILPTMAVKKKHKKKEEKKKKKHSIKKAFNKLRPSLQVQAMAEDRAPRPASPTLSYDSGSGDEGARPVKTRPVKTFAQPVTDSVTVHWPLQCQVIPERADHLHGIPKIDEMFFNPTGREAQIQPIGKDFGEVVYNYEAKCDFSFYCKYGDEPVAGFSPPQLKNPIPKHIEPDSLLFESRFESGNLAKAVRITDTYYELQLRPDLYTDRHCQWFYFRVQRMRPNTEYRFSIINFGKPDSQYGSGMKPVMYSEVEAAKSGVGWQRAGHGMR
jgi:hypothetical protein